MAPACPVIRKEWRTRTAHSHHKAGTPGGNCIDCHMPKTRFANMNRSDHSMLPPTPAATLKFQSPNACTLCHKDKSASWADAKVRQWHKQDYQRPVLERAALVDAARKGRLGQTARHARLHSGSPRRQCDSSVAHPPSAELRRSTQAAGRPQGACNIPIPWCGPPLRVRSGALSHRRLATRWFAPQGTSTGWSASVLPLP